MRKFLRLLQNEIIKLVKKKSTLVMAALFLAMVIGLTGLLSIDSSSQYNENDDQQQSMFAFQMQVNFDNAKAMYEESLAYSEKGDLFAKQQSEYFNFLITNQIRFDDWRYTEGIYEAYLADTFALENGMAAENEDAIRERVEKMLTIIRKDDGWDNFCKMKLETLDGTPNAEEQRWFYTYAMEHDVEPSDKGLYALLVKTRQEKISLADILQRKRLGEAVSEDQIGEKQDAVTLLTYRLDNNITTDITRDVMSSSILDLNDTNFWSVFSSCRSFIKVIGVMCIAIAGSIVAVEFSQGTYKFLLMSPAKRWKILTAKLLTVLLFGIVALLALYLLSLLCCIIFFGTAELSVPLVSIVDGAVAVRSPFLTILSAYALSTVEILVMVMLALAISSLAKGNALAISVSIVVFLLGSLVETVLRSLDIDFGRYLVFANLDLPALYAGASFYPGQTFGFALAVIICHLAVFGLTAWDAFCRREM